MCDEIHSLKPCLNYNGHWSHGQVYTAIRLIDKFDINFVNLLIYFFFGTRNAFDP